MPRKTRPEIKYAKSVLAGRTPAGQRARLACERHLRDLKAKKYVFDGEAADRFVRFSSHLRHSKGQWAGSPLELEPWQLFIVGSLFGWRRQDGTRRFRTAYVEVPRKNGKTTLAAAIGLYLAFADGEAGAEVYTAATKRDQARIAHEEATRMVRKSPGLRKRLGVFKDNLHHIPTSSKFEPLGRDADSLDGLNVYAAIVDEVHAHPTRDLWDVLETATGARTQPLLLAITTAGWDRHTICWELHDYGVRLLERREEDDSFFCYIASADDGDDWASPETWRRANPNLGVSCSEEDLERKATKAKVSPAAQLVFRRKHLNEWTTQQERWIDLEKWDACDQPLNPDALRGQPCYAGLDLGSTQDLSALVLYFPASCSLLPFFWCPEEGIEKRSRTDRVPYEVWAQQGLLRPTEGNITDYNQIHSDIGEIAELYCIEEIGYDPWKATELVTNLQEEGLTMVPLRQGFPTFAAPMRELEALIVGGKLVHAGHPILRWMAGNVQAKQDPQGNLKPDRAASREKIDGIVSLCMALSRSIAHNAAGPSIYETRGLPL